LNLTCISDKIDYNSMLSFSMEEKVKDLEPFKVYVHRTLVYRITQTLDYVIMFSIKALLNLI